MGRRRNPIVGIVVYPGREGLRKAAIVREKEQR